MLINDYMLVTIDFETFYGRGYSISGQKYNTIEYVTHDKFKIQCVGIKIDDEDVEIFTHSELHLFDQLLKDLKKTNEPIALICHNTGFDGFILHHIFDWHPDYYCDTLSMSKGMFVGAPASLKALSKRLFTEDSKKRKGDELALSKDIYDLPPQIMEMLSDYCTQDVTLTYDAFIQMHAHFPDDEMYLINMHVRMFCEPWFLIDQELVELEIVSQVEAKKVAFAKTNVPETVLKSNTKFGIYLETLGYDLPTKENAKGKLIAALGQKDWPFLKFMEAHPELADVFAARKYAMSNIQETRARRFLNTAKLLDGKMPVPLKYYGAHTGRSSGGEKLNLQNLVRIDPNDPSSGRLRRALCAPEGYSVIVCDLASIEARITAWLSGNTELLDLYREGGDPYLLMASKIYNFNYAEALPLAKTDKSIKAKRSVGKAAVLGLGFGMGVNKFWFTMNTGPVGMDPIPTTLSEAENIVSIYRTANFPVVDYWAKCDAVINEMLTGNTTLEFGPLQLHNTNLILPNNMALQYPNLCMKEDIMGYTFQYSPELDQYGGLKTRKSLWGGTLTENIAQALARIVFTDQAVEIEKYLDVKYGLNEARVAHMVHDELIVIAPTQHAKQIFDDMNIIMSRPPKWAPDLPLEVEGGFARNYIK